MNFFEFCVKIAWKFTKFHFKNAKIKAKIHAKREFSVNLKLKCSISSEKSLLANEARLKAVAVCRSLLKAIYRRKTSQAEFKAHKFS